MRGLVAGLSIVAAVAASGLAARAPREPLLVISEISAATAERAVQWIDTGDPAGDAAHKSWLEQGFDDDAWPEGRESFGYGYEGVSTEVDLRGRALSLYLRTEFEIDEREAQLPGPWILEVDYDDGFVAYLDGREVARGNLGETGERIGHRRAADGFHEAGNAERSPLTGAQGLQPGRHVLAMQAHNVSFGSSDFLLRARIRSGGDSPIEVVGREQPWRYLVGLSEPPGPLAAWRVRRGRISRLGKRPYWTELELDEEGWGDAVGVVGSGRGDETTPFDAASGVSSVYFRRHFDLPVELTAADVEVAIDFKDGFVAFLNGREIGRRNLGAYGTHVYHDQRAYQARRSVDAERIIVPAAALRRGHNVLALQVHQHEPEDGQFRAAVQIRTLGEKGRVLSPWTAPWRYRVGHREPSGGLVDEDGELEDWIEIHNASAEAVALDGWSLTDDAGSPRKWRFPARILLPDEYLVVFASGKDRRPETGELHTNFRLRRSGEYLALYSPNESEAATELEEYPRQSDFHTWGLTDAGYRYLDRATPGAANHGDGALAGLLDPPRIEPAGGRYEEGPVRVEIVTDSPLDTVYYTLDGSAPTPRHGNRFLGGLTLDRTTVLRAGAFRPGHVASPVTTSVFLIDEPRDIREHPVLVLSGDPETALFEPYGVLAIVGGYWTDIQHWCFACWVPQGIDDFNHPLQHGRAFERPVTATFLEAGESEGFSVPAGLRFSGGSWRRRTLRRFEDWSDPLAKPSFRLYFRKSYGLEQLDYRLFPESDVHRFETLVVRGGHNDSMNPFVRDELVRRLHADMGHEAALGRFVSLFLNDEHKGYFNLVERPDESFFRHRYGDSLTWDLLRGAHREMVPEVASGDLVDWNELFSLLSPDSTGQAAYELIAGRLDLANFVDYVLLNAYAATADWPNANWLAARPRAAGGRFRFYVWDAEGAFGLDEDKGVDYDTLGVDLQDVASPITALFRHLVGYEPFRRLVEERYRLHTAETGALTIANVSRRFRQLQAEVGALVESVHGDPFDTTILEEWIPFRLSHLESSLRTAGLIAIEPQGPARAAARPVHPTGPAGGPEPSATPAGSHP